ncbi:hypothetical protein [Streptomyces sp. NPDC002788]
MRPENCVTRNHIAVWNERVLPPGAVRVTFGTVLRGSFVPLLVWCGVACFAYVVYNPVVALALGGLFALSVLAGIRIRRKARHSLRCSFYGALGGVLDKSMAGF